MVAQFQYWIVISNDVFWINCSIFKCEIKYKNQYVYKIWNKFTLSYDNKLLRMWTDIFKKQYYTCPTDMAELVNGELNIPNIIKSVDLKHWF